MKPTAAFEFRALMFTNLCVKFGVPVPVIKPPLNTDPCDFTSPSEVRLNLKAANAEGASPEHHVRHNFGHYLCGLHEADDSGQDVGIDCNRVADIIAEWITKEEQLVRADSLLRMLFNNGLNALPVDKSNALCLYFTRQEHPEAAALLDQLEENIPCLR